jgi:hypothetical protein
VTRISAFEDGPRPARHGYIWTSYCYSGSSVDILFQESAGESGDTGDRLRSLLRDFQAEAELSPLGRRGRVTLLQSGPDGGSSNNDTWPHLVESFPNLDFSVVIVMPGLAIWDPRDFYIDNFGNGWRCFDVDALSAL